MRRRLLGNGGRAAAAAPRRIGRNPLLAARAASGGRSEDVQARSGGACCRRLDHRIMRPRRSAANSIEASRETRERFHKNLKQVLRARIRAGEYYVDAAERPLPLFPCGPNIAEPFRVWCTERARRGQTVFMSRSRPSRCNNQLVQLCRDEARGNPFGILQFLRELAKIRKIAALRPRQLHELIVASNRSRTAHKYRLTRRGSAPCTHTRTAPPDGARTGSRSRSFRSVDVVFSPSAVRARKPASDSYGSFFAVSYARSHSPHRR